MSGYVRIHRTLIGHPVFRNDAEAMVFAWLVTQAQWKQTRVRYRDHIIHLQRGQLAISLRDLAFRFDRDKAWISRLLKRLENEAMIETASETGVTVITLCNYNEYQSDPVLCETPRETRNETGARQGRDTEQVREEGKKERSEAKASSERVLAHYRQMAKANGLPDVRVLNASRKQSLRLRIAEVGEDAMIEAIDRIPRSKFLLGKSDRQFKADLDFLLQPKSLARILEGFYGEDAQAAKPKLSPDEHRAQLEKSIPFYEKIGRTDDANEARRKLASIGTVASDIVRSVGGGHG